MHSAHMVLQVEMYSPYVVLYVVEFFSSTYDEIVELVGLARALALSRPRALEHMAPLAGRSSPPSGTTPADEHRLPMRG